MKKIDAKLLTKELSKKLKLEKQTFICLICGKETKVLFCNHKEDD